MELGSTSLQKVGGARMRSILGTLTTNRFMGLLLGAFVTLFVQSSSATSVMVVGFVSAGMMNLLQAIGVLLGAMIGTTLTVQIIAFKVTDYALLMIGLGFVATFVTKRKTYIYLGEIAMGMGMLFYGMAVMSMAMAPLRSIPAFSEALLTLGQQPILGVLVSTAFTGLIQSSGATIGLAIVLGSEGLMTFDTAMPIILGANIGTAVTTLFALVKTTPDGRRAGLSYMSLRFVSAVLFFPFMGMFVPVVEHATQLMGSTSVARQIANGHMFYNALIAFFWLPWLKYVAKAMEWLVRKPKEAEPEFAPKFLNNDLLETPDLALTAAYQEILRVSDTAGLMIQTSLDVFDPKVGEKAREDMEQHGREVEILCEELRRYYVRLAQKDIGLMQSREKQGHMSIMDDLRQIGQLIGTDVLGSAESLAEKGVSFSDEGRAELDEYLVFTLETHDETEEAMRQRDLAMAKQVRKRKGRG